MNQPLMPDKVFVSLVHALIVRKYDACIQETDYKAIYSIACLTLKGNKGAAVSSLTVCAAQIRELMSQSWFPTDVSRLEHLINMLEVRNRKGD